MADFTCFDENISLLVRMIRALFNRAKAQPLDPAMMARLADEVAEDTVGFDDMRNKGAK